MVRAPPFGPSADDVGFGPEGVLGAGVFGIHQQATLIAPYILCVASIYRTHASQLTAIDDQAPEYAGNEALYSSCTSIILCSVV